MNRLLTIIISSFLIATSAVAAPAPDFTGRDLDGKEHKLSEFKGKVVVLEWYNPGCPYVKKHYETGNMQKLQKAATDKGVVWLTINSSSPGKQGSMTTEEARAQITEWNLASSAYLVDKSGEIGKAYGAKTTPHMYVIDQKGELAYQGAIDDNDSSSKTSIEGAKNYVQAAITEILEGKSVTTPSTTPYGCSVKYESK